jgi:hypothetical protein
MRSSGFWYLREHTVRIRAERTTGACAPSYAEVCANHDWVDFIRNGQAARRPALASTEEIRR